MKYGIALAGIALVLAGCSTAADDTIDVKGTAVGTVGSDQDLMQRTSCTFTDGTLTNGDPVVITSADGAILGKGTLDASSVNAGPACPFTFTVNGVKSGESGYSIKVGSYEPSWYPRTI